MKLKISEKDMADAFEKRLCENNAIQGFPQFQSVYRELTCQQGIADFIALAGIKPCHLPDISLGNINVSLDTCTLIMSFLKPKAPRTKDFLIKATGFSLKTVNKALDALSQSQLVIEVKPGMYTLHHSWAVPHAELWAFELKLSNWKRAIFQAMRYRAFAHRVVIVFPQSKRIILQNNISMFRNLGLGLLVFDTYTGHSDLLLKPKKNSPMSKHHTLFTLGKLASETKCDGFIATMEYPIL